MEHITAISQDVASIDCQQKDLLVTLQDVPKALAEMQLQHSSEIASTVSSVADVKNRIDALRSEVRHMATEMRNPALSTAFAVGVKQAIEELGQSEVFQNMAEYDFKTGPTTRPSAITTTTISSEPQSGSIHHSGIEKTQAVQVTSQANNELFENTSKCGSVIGRNQSHQHRSRKTSRSSAPGISSAQSFLDRRSSRLDHHTMETFLHLGMKLSLRSLSTPLLGLPSLA